MDLREEQVVLETDRYRISGTLTMPREGYRSRLSDYVNQRDREFFTVSNATVTDLEGAPWTGASRGLVVAHPGAHAALLEVAAAGRAAAIGARD